MPRGGLADPGFRKTKTGQKVLSGQPTGGGGGLNVPVFDPSKFAASAGADTGVRALTPKDVRTMQANTQKQLAAGLIGPFTPEAVKSGYASTVASLYGVNYPAQEKWTALAMRNRWDQTTFERWLRSRPEFQSTSVGRKMRADAITVLAQVMGVI